VLAESAEEAKAKVLEDFAGRFTNVEIDEVSQAEEDDDECEDDEDRYLMWDVYVNAKGKNLEYWRLLVCVSAKDEEEASSIVLKDFSSSFRLQTANVTVEERVIDG